MIIQNSCILADATFLVDFKMDTRRFNDQIHANLTKFNLKVTAKGGRIAVEGLLNGRAKFLEDLFNQSINDNFDIFTKEAYPSMAKSVAEAVSKHINKIFEKFTKAQLFPS